MGRIRGAAGALFLAGLAWGLTGCTATPRFVTPGPVASPHTVRSAPPLEAEGDYRTGQVLLGEASWYGADFHGRPTASGEIFDMGRVSGAHRELPLGTWVQVRNLANGRVLEVLINDRGPFKSGRILDLSREAARRLDFLDAGTASVEIRILTLPDPSPRP